ncbi:GMC oxidoreductase [Methylovulum psychrotolerans]|uniref:Glucose-methanol-choline oxidoreductase C-terminal domain-containing protein n=1 Tax=Methylovulum psychrotolerans TaxID=1704499 RepID=A0A2S5CT29_9GAMM|nr:GMC oxidoreductase [Methylovulum psychrotolerans]POZ53980.1 hypothetical protein AADEFJLK_01022 [Methylovulum psychrotolerans]
MRVAVIGSGLAAVATLNALVARGLKPIVLDYGECLDTGRQQLVDTLSALPPQQWAAAGRAVLCHNPTLANKQAVPTKLAFGSDYFYGRPQPLAPLLREADMPPLSYAYGGLSVGWGGSALPADACDMADWPLAARQLHGYYAQILARLPYSACADSLSLNFPLHKTGSDAVRLSAGNRLLLAKMAASGLAAKDRVVFGQARLLLQLADTPAANACQYCGCCMSGCVYGAIYKASQDIDRLRAAQHIEYVGGVLVQELAEAAGQVRVSLVRAGGEPEVLTFDRVFVAAGAVGSTRLVLQSKRLYGQAVRLKSTGGFVMPLFSVQKMPSAWPHENTLPGVFLEFKVKGLSEHWVHTQLSTPNEMVLAKLGLAKETQGAWQSLKRLLSAHLLVAHCNLHSDHCNGYSLQLEQAVNGPATLVATPQHLTESRHALKKTAQALFTLGRQWGCYALLPFSQTSASFHVGGSLPMCATPVLETDTDSDGRPKGWQRIHIVDSSVFPSLPGTTIGLLAMANASRIASEVELS